MDRDSIYAELQRENERLKRVATATATALITRRKRDSEMLRKHWRKSDDEAAYICNDRHVVTFGEMAQLISIEAQNRRRGEVPITDDAVMRLADRCGGAYPEAVLRTMGNEDFDLMVKFDPFSEGGYRCISSSIEMQRKYQDVLDAFYQERIFDIRGNLRNQSWSGALYADRLISPDGLFFARFEPAHIGAGRNIVGGKWFLESKDGILFSVRDLPFTNAIDIATAITARAAAANLEVEARHCPKKAEQPKQW